VSADPEGLVTSADPAGSALADPEAPTQAPALEPPAEAGNSRIDAVTPRADPLAPSAYKGSTGAGLEAPPISFPAPDSASTPPSNGSGSSATRVDRSSVQKSVTVRRVRKARRRARRVTRVIRRIDLWSVLKLALVLYTCLYAATLASLAAIWGIAYSTGLIDKLQSFLGDVGLDNFRFYGDQMFRACAAIGAVLVLAGTLITVLTVALINLISELTGGIRVVVIEEEPWPSEREQVAADEAQPLPSDPAAGL